MKNYDFIIDCLVILLMILAIRYCAIYMELTLRVVIGLTVSSIGVLLLLRLLYFKYFKK